MENLGILTWVFFVLKGITDNTDLMRAQMFILECISENATVESVKNSPGYKSCLCDLPHAMLTDEYIQQIIDFKLL